MVLNKLYQICDMKKFFETFFVYMRLIYVYEIFCVYVMFTCLYLNTKNQVLHKHTVFIGSLNSSIVHPREIFKEAFKRSAASFICVHNHPSGDPTPSREDIEVTQRLFECGKLIGIQLLDHLVIGDQKFVSLKEKGYL
ncbi:DNA repair protein RadC [Bacillus pumilus]|nr:DNA repair protein RadC [Bacillus pumilus]TYS53440.1 DNA repair protein RadC [Bacillus pumilus]